MQASPRPPGPMTAAAAQRQADYNKKQSFPLSPPTARPPSAFPLPSSVMQNEPAPALRLQVPNQPSRAAPGSARRPLSASNGAPASGVSFSPPPHPQPPGHPQPDAQRKNPNYGAKLYACNRHGVGKTKEGVGGAHALCGHFRWRLVPGAAPPTSSLSHQRPRKHTHTPPAPAHQSTLSCHARVAGGAPRRSQSPGRRLAFPSPSIAERAPGPRAAGGPRRPQTVFPPPSCRAFLPGGSAGSQTRKMLSPPACPRAPQPPKPLAGNWQETPRCGRRRGAAGGQEQHAGYGRPEDQGTPGTGTGA